MSLFVKICGLRDARDVNAAVAAGANAVGFVFAASPRQVFSREVLLDRVWGSSSEWQTTATVLRPWTDFCPAKSPYSDGDPQYRPWAWL